MDLTFGSIYLIVFFMGVLVGYFAWRVKKIESKLDRVMTVLAQAGPNIASRIEEGGTKVVLTDRWDEEFSGR